MKAKVIEITKRYYKDNIIKFPVARKKPAVKHLGCYRAENKFWDKQF